MENVSAQINSVTPDWYALAQPGGKIGQDGYTVSYTMTVLGNDPVEKCNLPMLLEDDSTLQYEDRGSGAEPDCTLLQPGDQFTAKTFTAIDLASQSHLFYFIINTQEPVWKLTGTVTIGPKDITD